MKTHDGNSSEARRERAEQENRDSQGRFEKENNRSNSSKNHQNPNMRKDNSEHENRDSHGRSEKESGSGWCK